MRERRLAARQFIVKDGDRPKESCLIADGFAFRSKTTADGNTQILSIHIPGEIPDLQSLHLNVMDHDLITVTPCTLGFILHDDLNALARQRPNLAAAFWRETLIDASIFREWITNIGRREAMPRMAHLLLELHTRLKAIGHTRDSEFGIPITQNDLSECLGLSAVHTNRVIQHLRKDGLLTLNRSDFHILDRRKMEELAGFDPSYLHLDPNT